MWGGRNTLQPHPSNIRGMSRSVTGTGLLGPLMLQIETKPLSAHTTDVSTPQPNRAVAEYPPTSSFQPASPGS